MEKLEQSIKELVGEGLCVAFSGGVDSSLLLALACAQAKLQNTVVFAVTFETKLHPCADVGIARTIAQELGAMHRVIQVNELENKAILQNPVDRCYQCKKYLFENLIAFAKENGLQHIIDGTNFDDLSQYRPGIRALQELGIHSPLAALGITKAQVRTYAQSLGLSVSNRPSAPCLATRLPYGTQIDFALLAKIDAGETFLKAQGFLVNRIRVHGDIARIEIPKSDFTKFLQQTEHITKTLKELGLPYLTLDLEGFRSGSMDIYVRGEAWT